MAKTDKAHIIPLIFLCLLFLGVTAFCGYHLYGILLEDKNAKDDLKSYKPKIEVIDATKDNAEEIVQLNPTFAEIKSINPDCVGWITVPDTKIDYPVAQTTNNDYYLKHDIYRKSTQAGAIFLDYRYSYSNDFNLALFGHNMNNGSMFGGVKKFANKQYFNTHRTGYYVTDDGVKKITFFAYLVVDPRSDVYSMNLTTDENKAEHLKYIADNAKIYYEPDNQQNIITLSTCSYEFKDARAVLIGVLE